MKRLLIVVVALMFSVSSCGTNTCFILNADGTAVCP